MMQNTVHPPPAPNWAPTLTASSTNATTAAQGADLSMVVLTDQKKSQPHSSPSSLETRPCSPSPTPPPQCLPIMQGVHSPKPPYLPPRRQGAFAAVKRWVKFIPRSGANNALTWVYGAVASLVHMGVSIVFADDWIPVHFTLPVAILLLFYSLGCCFMLTLPGNKASKDKLRQPVKPRLISTLTLCLSLLSLLALMPTMLSFVSSSEWNTTVNLIPIRRSYRDVIHFFNTDLSPVPLFTSVKHPITTFRHVEACVVDGSTTSLWGLPLLIQRSLHAVFGVVGYAAQQGCGVAGHVSEVVGKVVELAIVRGSDASSDGLVWVVKGVSNSLSLDGESTRVVQGYIREMIRRGSMGSVAAVKGAGTLFWLAMQLAVRGVCVVMSTVVWCPGMCEGVGVGVVMGSVMRLFVGVLRSIIRWKVRRMSGKVAQGERGRERRSPLFNMNDASEVGVSVLTASCVWALLGGKERDHLTHTVNEMVALLLGCVRGVCGVIWSVDIPVAVVTYRSEVIGDLPGCEIGLVAGFIYQVGIEYMFRCKMRRRRVVKSGAVEIGGSDRGPKTSIPPRPTLPSPHSTSHPAHYERSLMTHPTPRSDNSNTPTSLHDDSWFPIELTQPTPVNHPTKPTTPLAAPTLTTSITHRLDNTSTRECHINPRSAPPHVARTVSDSQRPSPPPERASPPLQHRPSRPSPAPSISIRKVKVSPLPKRHGSPTGTTVLRGPLPQTQSSSSTAKIQSAGSKRPPPIADANNIRFAATEPTGVYKAAPTPLKRRSASKSQPPMRRDARKRSAAKATAKASQGRGLGGRRVRSQSPKGDKSTPEAPFPLPDTNSCVYIDSVSGGDVNDITYQNLCPSKTNSSPLSGAKDAQLPSQPPPSSQNLPPLPASQSNSFTSFLTRLNHFSHAKPWLVHQPDPPSPPCSLNNTRLPSVNGVGDNSSHSQGNQSGQQLPWWAPSSASPSHPAHSRSPKLTHPTHLSNAQETMNPASTSTSPSPTGSLLTSNNCDARPRPSTSSLPLTSLSSHPSSAHQNHTANSFQAQPHPQVSIDSSHLASTLTQSALLPLTSSHTNTMDSSLLHNSVREEALGSDTGTGISHLTAESALSGMSGISDLLPPSVTRFHLPFRPHVTHSPTAATGESETGPDSLVSEVSGASGESGLDCELTWPKGPGVTREEFSTDEWFVCGAEEGGNEREEGERSFGELGSGREIDKAEDMSELRQDVKELREVRGLSEKSKGAPLTETDQWFYAGINGRGRLGQVKELSEVSEASELDEVNEPLKGTIDSRYLLDLVDVRLSNTKPLSEVSELKRAAALYGQSDVNYKPNVSPCSSDSSLTSSPLAAAHLRLITGRLASAKDSTGGSDQFNSHQRHSHQPHSLQPQGQQSQSCQPRAHPQSSSPTAPSLQHSIDAIRAQLERSRTEVRRQNPHQPDTGHQSHLARHPPSNNSKSLNITPLTPPVHPSPSKSLYIPPISPHNPSPLIAITCDTHHTQVDHPHAHNSLIDPPHPSHIPSKATQYTTDSPQHINTSFASSRRTPPDNHSSSQQSPQLSQHTPQKASRLPQVKRTTPTSSLRSRDGHTSLIGSSLPRPHTTPSLDSHTRFTPSQGTTSLNRSTNHQRSAHLSRSVNRTPPTLGDAQQTSSALSHHRAAAHRQRSGSPSVVLNSSRFVQPTTSQVGKGDKGTHHSNSIQVMQIHGGKREGKASETRQRTVNEEEEYVTEGEEGKEEHMMNDSQRSHVPQTSHTHYKNHDRDALTAFYRNTFGMKGPRVVHSPVKRRDARVGK
eukprot:GHVN01066745.1.p1 GENE.GHVN01066745.1~~GHVN01066745.1.p1  ORF type:complete len:1776 (+),score=445.59 GHVN01066745.1:1046-6373(+)